MIKELRKRPFVRLLFLWITGTLLQYFIPYAFGFAYLLLLPATIGVGCFFFSSFRNQYDKRWFWGAGFACIILFLSIQFTYYKHKTTEWNYPDQELLAQAVVTNTPSEKARSVSCSLLLTSVLINDSVVYTCKNVQAYFEKDSSIWLLTPGSRLLLKAQFRSSDVAYLRNKGIAATLYLASDKWLLINKKDQLSLRNRLLCWRNDLLQKYTRLNLSEQEQAVLSALTFGYTAGMSKDQKQRFSITGVSHILSVSGFHVAIVCGFISLLLSFLPEQKIVRYVRYLITNGLLWGFTAMTGFSTPAVRAALMITFYLTGQLFRRTTDGYNTMAASAFFMLVYNPFYLFDIGFELSYLAVFSILYLQPRFNKILTIRNPLFALLWGWITVTLAAQIGTTPLCMYSFGLFSTVFLFTNLPLTIIATFLIPVALVWVFLPPWIPGYTLLQQLTELLTHWLLVIVDKFSTLPAATFTFSFDWPEMLFCYGAGIFLLIYRRNKRPQVLLFCLFLVFILLLMLLTRKNMLFSI